MKHHSDKQLDGTWQVSDTDQKAYRDIINQVRDYCQMLELKTALRQIERISQTIENGAMLGAYQRLIEEGGELERRIEEDLQERLFFYMPIASAEYYDQEKLFGNSVYDNFQLTRDDVKEAANCFAVERYTACVFHCMRVVEKGLHVLVEDLNDRFNAGILFPKGIEAANWGTIIERIESLLTTQSKLQQLTPQLTPQDKQFYSRAAKEFQYFKDAWRNEVSHSRSSYDENEAKTVMEHVRAFMQHLAGRLHD